MKNKDFLDLKKTKKICQQQTCSIANIKGKTPGWNETSDMTVNSNPHEEIKDIDKD